LLAVCRYDPSYSASEHPKKRKAWLVVLCSGLSHDKKTFLSQVNVVFGIGGMFLSLVLHLLEGCEKRSDIREVVFKF